MPSFGQEITDFVSGVGLQVRRSVAGIPDGEHINSGTFTAKTSESATSNIFQVSATVIDDGTDGDGLIDFDITRINTGLLTPGTSYYYLIQITSSGGTVYTLETGNIISLSDTGTTKQTAAFTNARAATEYSVRTNKIINEYLDFHLGDLRQLTCWDEHARRTSYDPLLLQLTYRNWNTYVPQVYDAQNTPVPSNHLFVDPKNGTIRVDGDTGYDDYFVTYEFDLGSPEQLKSLIDLKTQELNLAGSGDRSSMYLTKYASIDESPLSWDAPLVMSCLASFFRRIAFDSMLWKNYLIWQDGSAAQQMATEAASFYYQSYQDMAKNLKMEHLIASATDAFQQFSSVGFGFFSCSGGKFRELRVSRLTVF